MVVVFKVGGSLIGEPWLAERLTAVLRQRPNATPLIIAGGGEAADIVRKWDAVCRLGDVTAHRLAIRAMDFNAEFLASILPNARLIDGRDEFDDSPDAVNVLRVSSFLSRETSPQSDLQPLPESWEVTGDSIAAWITLAWPAAELVLIKSREMPMQGSDDGAVDAYFGHLSPRLSRLGWVNLRSDSPTIDVATQT